jgi:hypothetical protein
MKHAGHAPVGILDLPGGARIIQTQDVVGALEIHARGARVLSAAFLALVAVAVPAGVGTDGFASGVVGVGALERPGLARTEACPKDGRPWAPACPVWVFFEDAPV